MVGPDMLRPDRMIRGQRLRIVREDQQLSRRELATRVRSGDSTINEKTIERLEKGSHDTEDEIVDAVCAALDTPREEIDGDLRAMRLPGYTEMRRQISLIWRVIQTEYADTAARIEEEDLVEDPPVGELLSPAELQRRVAELQQELADVLRRAGIRGGSSAEDRRAG